jgi:hypothetical protein
MTARHLSAVLAALICAAVAGSALAAQPYRAPRTAYGQPDLQGFWTNLWLTQLERDPATPLTYATPAEEVAYEARSAKARAAQEASGLGQGVSEWHPELKPARIDGRLRTSWIVSPADGRLPYRPGAQARFDAINDAAVRQDAEGPENRTPGDRCLMAGFGASGPPFLNPRVAAVKQIVQTRTEIALLSEMNHDVRIVRLGTKARPPRHPPANVRMWMGDSVGWWEGETLVVETSNFHPQEQFRAMFLMSPDARVTERFTRVSRAEILYEWTVDDPATFTQAWRAQMPLAADPGPIYEFACHEGNYGLTDMLATARRNDAAAKEGGR